jgi:hypothetical protein
MTKRDVLKEARTLIYKEMRKQAPVSTVIEAKLPQNLVQEFKAMPGIVSENFRAALGLYVKAVGLPGQKRGLRGLRTIIQEFVIERPKKGTPQYQPLESIGARLPEDLVLNFKALPGITAHNIEKALRLYLLAMKTKPRKKKDG